MKVIQHSVENYRRIKMIMLKPKAWLSEVTGKNEQGKSSFIDSIPELFLGYSKTEVPDKIHKGDTSAKIEAIVGDDKSGEPLAKITKDIRVTSDNTTIEEFIGGEFKPVKVKGGVKSLLKNLFGTRTVNLDEVASMSAKDIFNAIINSLPESKKAMNAIVASQDLAKKERKWAKKLRDDAKASLPSIVPEEKEVVDVADLKSELTDYKIEQRAFDNYGRIKTQTQDEVTYLTTQITQLQYQLEIKVNQLAELTKNLPDDYTAEIERIENELANAGIINVQAKDYVDYLANKKDYDKKVETADRFESEVAKFEKEKTELIKSIAESVNIPHLGFDIDQEIVTYKGRALTNDQASKSAKILTMIPLAISEIPTEEYELPGGNKLDGLRVLSLKSGAYIDLERRELISDLCEKHNVQVLLEDIIQFKVEDDKLVPDYDTAKFRDQVVIDDGKVK